jgi:hypothetical protein
MVQRARRGAERGIRRADQGEHASAPVYHQSQYAGALLTQSVAPLGAPPIV